MKGKGKWVRVTAAENIPLREGRAIRIGGHEIAVFNLGERFLAVDARCPHRGGPLADGIVTGATVVCPLHAWKINLETGGVMKAEANPPCVATYRTRLEADIVMIEVPETPAESPGPALFCGEGNFNAAKPAAGENAVA